MPRARLSVMRSCSPPSPDVTRLRTFRASFQHASAPLLTTPTLPPSSCSKTLANGGLIDLMARATGGTTKVPLRGSKSVQAARPSSLSGSAPGRTSSMTTTTPQSKIPATKDANLARSLAQNRCRSFPNTKDISFSCRLLAVHTPRGKLQLAHLATTSDLLKAHGTNLTFILKLRH